MTGPAHGCQLLLPCQVVRKTAVILVRLECGRPWVVEDNFFSKASESIPSQGRGSSQGALRKLPDPLFVKGNQLSSLTPFPLTSLASSTGGPPTSADFIHRLSHRRTTGHTANAPDSHIATNPLGHLSQVC